MSREIERVSQFQRNNNYEVCGLYKAQSNFSRESTIDIAHVFAALRLPRLCFAGAASRRHSNPNRLAPRPAISPFPRQRSSRHCQLRDVAKENRWEYVNDRRFGATLQI